MFYATPPKAWTDDCIMLMWIEKILVPYIQTAPPGVVPLLLLNHFSAHMSKSTRKALLEAGVEVEYIPGGCTGLVQPIDVGISKPLKGRAQFYWEQWMMEAGLKDAVTRPPTCKQVSEWSYQSWTDITQQVCINAWRHDVSYTYYPHTCDPCPMNHDNDTTTVAL